MVQILGPNGKPLRNGQADPAALKRTDFAIGHVSTFQGIVSGISKAYRWAFDEALRQSPENARSMRRDGTVMALLRERQMPTASAAYHLEPEDDKDKRQKAVCDKATDIIKAIPYFTELRRELSEAIWFGRYGVQLAITRRIISGRPRYCVANFQPVQGDKFVFRWDGTPGVLISQLWSNKYQKGGEPVGITDPYVEQLRRQGGVVLPTDRGLALFLETPQWRDRFIIHCHEREDADFTEPELAGGIFGVGLRHRCYYLWWLRQEVLSWMMDYLARVGAGGLTLISYDASNPNGKAQAEDIAAKMEQGSVLIVPRWTNPNEKNSSAIERIEPNDAGSKLLLEIVTDFFDRWMERMFVGQSMSSGADNSSGLGGTGRANFAEMTKQQLITIDAANLDETLTEQLVRRIMAWNFPDENFKVRFVTDLAEPDHKDTLESYSKAYEMGAELVESEVLKAAGLSVPQPGEKTLSMSQQQQDQGGQEGQQQGDPQTQQMFQGALDSGQLFDQEGLQQLQKQLGSGQGPQKYARFDESKVKRASDGRFGTVAGQHGTHEPHQESHRERAEPAIIEKLETLDGDGTAENPYQLHSDIETAAHLLAFGFHVELDQPDEICILTDKLHKEIQRIVQATGIKPNINLCHVTVQRTSLFCQDNKDIPRILMPQLTGEARPGSYAATKKRNKFGEVDISEEFISFLEQQGIEVQEDKVPVSHLRATQNELNGATVSSMVNAAEKGNFKPQNGKIFITKDNYILDGHHRWAALIGYQGYEDKELKIGVHRLNMDIGKAIAMANDFAGKAGMSAVSWAPMNKLKNSTLSPELWLKNLHDALDVPEAIEEFSKLPTHLIKSVTSRMSKLMSAFTRNKDSDMFKRHGIPDELFSGE